MLRKLLEGGGVTIPSARNRGRVKKEMAKHWKVSALTLKTHLEERISCRTTIFFSNGGLAHAGKFKSISGRSSQRIEPFRRGPPVFRKEKIEREFLNGIKRRILRKAGKKKAFPHQNLSKKGRTTVGKTQTAVGQKKGKQMFREGRHSKKKKFTEGRYRVSHKTST